MKTGAQSKMRILVAALGYALVLAGCAVGTQATTPEPEPTAVEYQGNVLVVKGIRYLQEPTPSDFSPGNVLVFAKSGETESVQAALVHFGLPRTLHKSVAGDWFVVEVRNGFETQWVAALKALSGVASAHLNHRVRPA